MRLSKRLQREIDRKKTFVEEHSQVSNKACGYCRVSTSEQVSSGYGLEMQEEAIRAFAKSQGYELVEIVKDAGVPGTVHPAKREGFKRVLGLAEQGEISILLVWKIDRLSRKLSHAFTVGNDLHDTYHVALRSVTEQYVDLSTTMGQGIFALFASLAEKEREDILRRTHGGKAAKARSGGFAGGMAPYGYDRTEEGLVIVPEEAKVIRRIFKMKYSGKSPYAIAKKLNEEDVPTKRGGKWTPHGIEYILDNPKYRGNLEYDFDHFDPTAPPVVVKGRHQAII